MKLRLAVAVVAAGLLPPCYAQERVRCPEIRQVEVSTHKYSNNVSVRFETDNPHEFYIEGELRVGWDMEVAVRVLPQFGGGISTQNMTRRVKLDIEIPPGHQRHDERASLDSEWSEGTMGAVGRSIESMSPPMAAEARTYRLDYDTNYTNGFILVRCRK